MHIHGPGCGHQAVVHDGHIDFLVDGELINGEQIHEITNEGGCQNSVAPHSHSEACLLVRHGDHYDCLLNDRLYYRHGGHDDDHGLLLRAEL